MLPLVQIEPPVLRARVRAGQGANLRLRRIIRRRELPDGPAVPPGGGFSGGRFRRSESAVVYRGVASVSRVDDKTNRERPSPTPVERLSGPPP